MLTNPFHPGELLQETLSELGVSAYQLAKETHMPRTRISAIINGKRGITADSAKRLGLYLGTTPQYWLNLQNSYDLSQTEVSGITPLQQRA